MAGTKTGGQKARDTNIRLYGEDYYKNIGAAGGRNGNTGGFYDSRPWYKKLFHPKNPHAQEAGRKGGTSSKRGRHLSEQQGKPHYINYV